MDTLTTDSSSASGVESSATATTDQSSGDSYAPQDGGNNVDSSRANAASGVDATIANLDNQYREAKKAPVRDDTDGDVDQTTQPETLKAEPKDDPTETEVADELETAAEDTDPLEERTGPRTLKDFDKLFGSSQKTARQELAKLEAANWEYQQTIEAIGGKQGIEIAKPLMSALFAANPTTQIVGADGQPVLADDGNPATIGDQALDAIVTANPELGVEMSRRFLSHALNETAIDPATKLPIGVATGNAIIKQYLSPNHTVESLQKLIDYDEKGLLDHDELSRELELYGTKSTREQELEARLKAIEDKDKAAETDKEQKTRAAEEERTTKATQHVSQQVMGAVIPIAERFGWTATKEELNSTDPAIKELAESKIAMGEMLTDHMEALKTRTPEWSAVEHLIKTGQAFHEDGTPKAVFVRNRDALVAKLLHAFKQKVRTLNPTFAKSFASSRNVQLKEKTTRSGKVDTAIPPVKKVEPPRNGTDPADLIAQHDEAYRRARVQAG